MFFFPSLATAKKSQIVVSPHVGGEEAVQEVLKHFAVCFLVALI